MTQAATLAEGIPDQSVRADDLEQWLHRYQQMLTIRLFEEEVNELYKSRLMPGLAHQYSGEEAVAVGVCEALRRDDTITSTLPVSRSSKTIAPRKFAIACWAATWKSRSNVV